MTVPMGVCVAILVWLLVMDIGAEWVKKRIQNDHRVRSERRVEHARRYDSR